MSYSLCAKFKNLPEQEMMYHFYRCNKDIIESFSIAEGRRDFDSYKDLKFDDSLIYSPKVNYLLGAEITSSTPYYLELILAFMCVKSSYRDRSKAPFLYYNYEKIKVTQKNILPLQVDERGIQSSETFLSLLNQCHSLASKLNLVKNFNQYSKLIEKSFTDLDNQWQKF